MRRQELIALFVAGIVILAVGILSSCSNSSVTTSHKSLYDRVMQSGKIRCAYYVFDPLCLKDLKTGKLTGIGPDTLELAAARLGLKVEWTEEVGWGSMIEGLQSNRYDLVGVPVWPNSNRARVADFSKPLCFSPVCAYVKSGDQRFVNSLEAINSPSVKISTLDGETSEVIAKNDFPKAQKLSLPQMSELTLLLLNVATGKADVAFAEPVFVSQFLKKNPHSLVNITPRSPVRIFANAWMFKRGEMEFKNMLDTTLDELRNSGSLETIVSKYETTPYGYYRVATPYQLPPVSPAIVSKP